MAATPPLQLVAPTDGVACSGSPVGIQRHQRDPAGGEPGLLARGDLRVDRDHAGRPPRQHLSIQPRPRRVSTPHLGEPDRELVLAGDRLHPAHDLDGQVALQRVEQHLDARAPGRPRPAGGNRARAAAPRPAAGSPSATPDRPLSTLDTVGADTPASRAIVATVISPRRRPRGWLSETLPSITAVYASSEPVWLWPPLTGTPVDAQTGSASIDASDSGQGLRHLVSIVLPGGLLCVSIG